MSASKLADTPDWACLGYPAGRFRCWHSGAPPSVSLYNISEQLYLRAHLSDGCSHFVANAIVTCCSLCVSAINTLFEIQRDQIPLRFYAQHTVHVMSHQPSSTVRVAVAQFEPAWLDLPKAVEKTCRLIREAAENGAKLVSFPECWIPGYPAWIWFVREYGIVLRRFPRYADMWCQVKAHRLRALDSLHEELSACRLR